LNIQRRSKNTITVFLNKTAGGFIFIAYSVEILYTLTFKLFQVLATIIMSLLYCTTTKVYIPSLKQRVMVKIKVGLRILLLRTACSGCSVGWYHC